MPAPPEIPALSIKEVIKLLLKQSIEIRLSMDSVQKSYSWLQLLGYSLKFENYWSPAFLLLNSMSLLLWIVMTLDFLLSNLHEIVNNVEEIANCIVFIYALMDIIVLVLKRRLLEKIFLDIELINKNGIWIWTSSNFKYLLRLEYSSHYRGENAYRECMSCH